MLTTYSDSLRVITSTEKRDIETNRRQMAVRSDLPQHHMDCRADIVRFQFQNFVFNGQSNERFLVGRFYTLSYTA